MSGNERLFNIIFGIIPHIVRALFIKTVWRPVAIVSSIVFYYTVLMSASIFGPLQQRVTLPGLAQRVCWILNAVVRVSFDFDIIVWDVGFAAGLALFLTIVSVSMIDGPRRRLGRFSCIVAGVACIKLIVLGVVL
ncbi:hypothetical protein C8R45DRAFT_450647 [Mycena sanguinolenta]|nr:hypothetical protein C8R45DRAFT_450647 [Mycena sanguinolenta]